MPVTFFTNAMGRSSVRKAGNVVGGEVEGLREAAWIARCVGRAADVPLQQEDLAALSRFLQVRTLANGEPVYPPGSSAPPVCIVREGCLELAVRRGRRRLVIQTLRPGDVDGDTQLLLGLPVPYEARASAPTVCLVIQPDSFDRLLTERPLLARRWLTSVAGRLARSHQRLTMLLGRSLPAQVAQLLLDEEVQGVVPFPQETLAAMLGARRPSVNRVLTTLRQEGLVGLSYRQVRIVDRSGLQRTARS